MKIMRFSIVIGLLFFIISCDETIPPDPYQYACEVTDPTRDLPWLREKIKSFEKAGENFIFIEQCWFDGNSYFIINNCKNKYYIPVYDCNGNKVCALSEFTHCAVADENLFPKKVIWQAKYSECE